MAAALSVKAIVATAAAAFDKAGAQHDRFSFSSEAPAGAGVAPAQRRLVAVVVVEPGIPAVFAPLVPAPGMLAPFVSAPPFTPLAVAPAVLFGLGRCGGR